MYCLSGGISKHIAMSTEIKNLEPKGLWKNFYDLTQIPRPSKKEEKAAQYVLDFGKKLGLESFRDEIGNVIVRKPATPGMENKKGVVIQGHIDMVPQANSTTDHNFETDPIDAYIDGDWVTARDTTLGADNGIGVAAGMAILEATDLEHGPIELFVTIDEEAGMTGAQNTKAGVLEGDILLNTDTEDDGVFSVGCAGGIDVEAVFDYSTEAVPAGYNLYNIDITGLKGGHSGIDIKLGRGNANKIMFRLLKQLHADLGVRLCAIDGGSLRNAIPREAFAKIAVSADKVEAYCNAIVAYKEVVAEELKETEPNFDLLTTDCDDDLTVICEADQIRLTHAINGAQNNVIRMSASMADTVETSSNLALVKADGQKISVCCLVRSFSDTAKMDLASAIESVFTLAGASVSVDGAYPGWVPNMESGILACAVDTYEALNGEKPELLAMHAGLECGILGAVYTHWEMLSFGPTIKFPHSPDEKINIETVQNFWKFFVELLKNIPEKN